MNIGHSQHVDQDSVENVMAIVLSFMENAIHDAGTYVEHSGRNIISKKDIRMALQAETFEYMNREDIDGSLLYYKEEVNKDIESHKGSSYEDSDRDSDCDSVHDIDEVETFLNKKFVKDTEMEEYTKSLCKCPICKRMNHAVIKWKTWTPTTDIERIFKKVIDTKM